MRATASFFVLVVLSAAAMAQGIKTDSLPKGTGDYIRTDEAMQTAQPPRQRPAREKPDIDLKSQAPSNTTGGPFDGPVRSGSATGSAGTGGGVNVPLGR